MSRTIKGSKGPGYDYWSRRTYKGLQSPNAENKRITRRYERRSAKQQIQNRQRGS